MKTSGFAKLLVAALGLVTSAVVASAQGEPPPVTEACANGGDIKCNCLPCSTPRRPTYRPPIYVPPPKNNAAAEHEAEIARERAREEAAARAAAVAAAEAKRKQEEFERDKEEAVKRLKGLDDDDLGLKGTTSDKFELKGLDTGQDSGVETSSLGLKGTIETQENRIYWRTVSVPLACRAAGACAVVDAYNLSRMLRGPDADRNFEEWVLEKAIKKVVLINLGAGESLDWKLDLTKAIYQAEARVFDSISQKIAAEMTEDPAKRAWLLQQMKLDDEAVQKLKEEIYAERQANVQASADYLRRNPDSRGIRFNCSSACQNLIQAANGLRVWP